MNDPLRSQIFLVDEPEGDPPKHYYVVISNNQRNHVLPNVLGLMVTTTTKSHLDAAVQLTPEDPVVGYVVADDIVRLWKDELTVPKGFMSSNTMEAIGVALKIALKLP